MTRHDTENLRLSAGYSLIEMLAVLTIIALIATIAMPNLMRPSAHWQLQAAAREIVTALRLTRTSAIARNSPLVMNVDVGRRTFQSAVVPLQRFPSDIVAELRVAEPERATASMGGFRFFPDGSSTGGDLRLVLNQEHASICVHWLTGEPRIAERC
ncbi:GspH/FimT family pseudopilin [Bradyrhizobium sp. INPA03-11B]|uniref:GspH/FimT family pseudopilin n=1 Tax=Bradyrhizobium sp. INPA03-11B TaxID=418598 RepID=UPI0033906F45